MTINFFNHCLPTDNEEKFVDSIYKMITRAISEKNVLYYDWALSVKQIKNKIHVVESKLFKQFHNH